MKFTTSLIASLTFSYTITNNVSVVDAAARKRKGGTAGVELRRKLMRNHERNINEARKMSNGSTNTNMITLANLLQKKHSIRNKMKNNERTNIMSIINDSNNNNNENENESKHLRKLSSHDSSPRRRRRLEEEVGDDNYYYNGCEVDPFMFLSNFYYADQLNCTQTPNFEETYCDFSNFVPILHAPCEYDGGTFHVVSMSSTCYDETFGMELTIDFDDLPFCAPEGCDIIDDIIEGGGLALPCEEPESFEFEIETVDPIIDSVCYEEVFSFTEEAGYGDPEYIFYALEEGGSNEDDVYEGDDHEEEEEGDDDEEDDELFEVDDFWNNTDDMFWNFTDDIFANFTDDMFSNFTDDFWNDDTMIIGDDNYVNPLFEEYCFEVSSTQLECKFYDWVEKLQGPCEEQGGILFTFTDSLTEYPVSLYYDEGEGNTEEDYGEPLYTTTFHDVPVCVGKSCDPKAHFEDFIFKLYAYEFNAYSYSEDREAYVLNIYTPIRYGPVTSSISTKSKKSKKSTKSPKATKAPKATKTPKHYSHKSAKHGKSFKTKSPKGKGKGFLTLKKSSKAPLP